MSGGLVEYASILAFIWTQGSYPTYLKDYWLDYKTVVVFSSGINVDVARIWKYDCQRQKGKPRLL